ncbi:transketolase [bacterium]|nr:transketolase [bacterium]MBU1753581.1 transketolase [bacterium]
MEDIANLKERAKEVRRLIIQMITEANSGHPGGSLSMTDIITTLYFSIMNHSSTNPAWEERDRFVLSKGHACPAFYAVLALCGYFPTSELMNLRKLGSILQGHPDSKVTPGVDFSTGSLGQGISAACGMALSGKIDKKDYRVYAIIGDGESQEGQVWEAAMSAAHYKLDNLCAFLDHNKLQIDGEVEKIMNIEPVVDKWKAFGWNTLRIDGHSFEQIIEAVEIAHKTKDKPTMIVADTIKGKGVSFMEGKVGFHGVAPTREQERQALSELA